MGCLLDHYRVCLGDVLASGIASHGFESDGAPGVGDSLAELRSHLRDGGIGRTGTIRAGRTATVLSIQQYRAAGCDPHGLRRHENKKLAWNGRCGDGFDHGFTLLFVEAPIPGKRLGSRFSHAVFKALSFNDFYTQTEKTDLRQ